jgi:trigger factor
LTEQKNFWVETTDGAFIPGFAAQLIGAQAGEKRTVHVDFPADFVTPQLQGKKGVYEVELVEVKEKALPPLDDELAKKYGAENLDKLKVGVRTDLENELKHSKTRALRSQIVRGLMGRVNFDLPETAVAAETRNVVYDIVRAVSRKLSSKAEPEGRIGGASQRLDRKTAGRSVEAQAKDKIRRMPEG